ncbi:MAG: hypothetical protein R3A47_11610 [Polyangiales bacterium]
MSSKVGDTCIDGDIATDAKAIWQMGYFDELSIDGNTKGDSIRLVLKVVERPAIADILYEGNGRGR